MDASTSRPIGVAVVAWGAIVLAVLMALSGAAGALVSLTFPAMPTRDPGFPALIEFIFRHFVLLATLQVAVAGVLLAAGRALLQLRKWGALVIQCFATLAILYLLAFTAVFVAQFIPGVSLATAESPAVGMVGIVA